MKPDFPIEVIIPAYNNNERLSLALWGYAQQTFKNFIIHISNDGGEDDTREILDKFPQLHFKYHYVSPKTEEYRPSLARNTALDAIKAKRVICTDADIIPSHDLVKSHLRFGGDRLIVAGRRSCIAESQIPELFEKFEKKRLSYSDFSIIEEDYRIRNNRPWLKFTACSWDAEFDDIFSSPVAWDCWSCNISYNTKDMKELGGFCTSYDNMWGGEDIDLAIRLIKYGNRIASLHDIGYHLNHELRSEADWEGTDVRLCGEWEDQSGNLVRNLS